MVFRRIIVIFVAVKINTVMSFSILHIMFVPAFLSNMRPLEIVIIILAILLLFGAKKIPSMMRNIGKGINSFKQGMRDMQEEIKKDPQSTDADEAKETQSSDKH